MKFEKVEGSSEVWAAGDYQIKRDTLGYLVFYCGAECAKYHYGFSYAVEAAQDHHISVLEAQLVQAKNALLAGTGLGSSKFNRRLGWATLWLLVLGCILTIISTTWF